MALQTPKQLADANKAAQGLGYTDVAGASRAISSDVLKDAGKGFVLTPEKPPVESAGLMGQIEQAQKNYTTGLQQQAQTAEQKKNNSLETLKSAMMDTPGQNQLTSTAYAQNGVNDIQKELDTINQQILEEQHALRRQTEVLQDNAQGRFGTAVNDMVLEKTRESLRKQADLSVIQMGIQGRFDSAKAIADRAVDVQMEKQKNIIDALAINYKDNKDLFTEAEKRAFEAKKTEMDRAYDAEKQRLQDISDISIKALEAGAPGSIIQAIRSAKTPAEAQAIAANFIAPRTEEERNLTMQSQRLDMDYKKEQLNALRNPKDTLRPTSVIDQNGKKLLVDTQTGEIIKDFGNTDASVSELQTAQKAEFINTIDTLKTSSGLSGSVGPNWMTRISPFSSITGAKQDFIAGVEQLTKGLTLDQLVNAKASGATFGALSEGEMKLLEQSATKINEWANKDDSGKITGYNATEKSFKQELDKISNFAKLDYVIKGGSPQDVGVQVMSDGTMWTINSDGSYTQLR